MNLFQQAGSLHPMRTLQTDCYSAIRQAVKEGHKRIIVQAPCGFGKTVLAAHLVASSIDKGRRPMFTCPAINLVEQTLRSFELQGIRDIGVLQAKHERTDWAAPMQIASVQTLVRRPIPEVDFVIIDEVHFSFKGLNEILDSAAWKNKVVVGLSATPWAKGLGLRWTKLIIAATVQKLIDEKLLCPFQVYAADENIDYATAKHCINEFGQRDFQDKWASGEMSKPAIVADIVDTWLKHRQNGTHPGDRTFGFAVDRAHAKVLRERFLSQGVEWGYIDGTFSDEERKRTFERYRNKQDKGIMSVGCLITGIDEDVRCLVDAQITESEIRHVQKHGRGLRNAIGKLVIPIFDHAGNTLRLGMVTDIYHGHLDMRDKTDRSEPFSEDKKPLKPKKCHECQSVIPSKSTTCPACGHKMTVTSDIEERAGDLVLVNPTSKSKREKKEDVTHEMKQQWYSGFLGIASERGHSDGWAAHRYKEKFGVWPRNLNSIAMVPQAQVRSFDHHCRIRYAKSSQKNKPAWQFTQ